jgi:uncharacterized protein YbjQ (UPF0145 family)
MSSSFDTSENLFVSTDQDDDSPPDFTDLFDEPGLDGDESGGVQSTATDRFQKVTDLEDDPKPYFKNTSFYQEALTGEGEPAKRLHANLAQFLKAEDAEDKSIYRSRLIPIFWELMQSLATKSFGQMPPPKKLLIRFGVLLPTMLDKDQRLMIAKIPEKKAIDQPIHYVDEWIGRVARGEINASATDETKGKGSPQASKIVRQVESARGKVEAQVELIKSHNRDMAASEENLMQMIRRVSDRDPRPEAFGEKGPYTEAQRAIFAQISNELRRMGNVGREIGKAFLELERYQDSLEKLQSQAQELGADSVQVDTKAAAAEMTTVRQMAKLCVGRQGNHFPLLYKQYFRGGLIGVATRENVNNVLADAEYLDPEIFERTFKQQTTRIVPNIILIPCYGDMGICWEPFERYNRATSRGRLAIPMYPKDLKTAVIAALGDLRWQVAKEKAAHYWMEEGLTGWYYQWFTEQKFKGDVKDQFIQDYILWITKESEGTQKLSREVRDIFWRYMPFPQDLKDELKNRGFVYRELYKKDRNRAMSDGY